MKKQNAIISIDSVLLDFNQNIVGHALSKECLNNWLHDKSTKLKTGIYYHANLTWFTDGSSLVTGIDFDNRVVIL